MISSLVDLCQNPIQSMSFFQQKMEKSEFLSFFYKHSMHVMTAPLFATTCDDRPSKGNPGTMITFLVQCLNYLFFLLSRACIVPTNFTGGRGTGGGGH